MRFVTNSRLAKFIVMCVMFDLVRSDKNENSNLRGNDMQMTPPLYLEVELSKFKPANTKWRCPGDGFVDISVTIFSFIGRMGKGASISGVR